MASRSAVVRPERRHRPVLLAQVALVVVFVLGYDWINNLAPLRAGRATGHGATILRWERAAHLDPERALNTWLAGRAVLAPVLNYTYDNAHFVVTFCVLAWVWWRRPAAYPRLRNALMLVNVVGFLVFWRLPVAPPRLLPGEGYVDTVERFHTFGDYHSGTLARTANQFAAMPSLHIGWAVWVAVALVLLARARWVRVTAALYAPLIAVVVLATGNHYLFDVLAGAATGALAFLVALLPGRLRQGRWLGSAFDVRTPPPLTVADVFGPLPRRGGAAGGERHRRPAVDDADPGVRGETVSPGPADGR